MADRTSIEWTDATWTPIKGCTRKSAGCVNCYAEVMAARFSRPGQWGEGLAKIVDTPAGKDHRWTGAIRFDEGELLKPFRWTRPRMIFVCSTSDLFHEAVTATMLDQVFAVMALAPQHTFQILTKRAERMREYLSDRGMPVRTMLAAGAIAYEGESGLLHVDVPKARAMFPLPNVWLGVSTEDQRCADERVPLLLETPAAVRWVSAEPLLGPINFRKWLDGREEHGMIGNCIGWTPPLDWVVAGGESGPGARPMHPDWVRMLRDQCAAAGVPFLFKQWGAWLDEQAATSMHIAPGPEMFDRFGQPKGDRWHPYEASDRNGGMMIRVGKKRAGRLLDGIEHNGFPPATEIPFG